MSITCFSSLILECKIKLESPWRSARLIPSMSMLPFIPAYFDAISFASVIGRSIFQYLATAFTERGKQMLSFSEIGGRINSCSTSSLMLIQ